MATNYTFERGKYGVLPGTIIAFARTLVGNDPTGNDFKQRIPAGFLRCDGSIRNGVDYPNLKQILGVGSNSKFRKEVISQKGGRYLMTLEKGDQPITGNDISVALDDISELLTRAQYT